MSTRQSWSSEEVEILKGNYYGGTIESIMEMLPGRGINSIKSKAAKLGISLTGRVGPRKGKKLTDEQVERLRRSHTDWTPEMEERLREVYATAKGEDLEEVFPQFTATQITQRAIHIGLHKDYEFFVETGVEGARKKWDGHRVWEPNKYGPDWSQTRRLARHKANYKCEVCGVNEDEYGQQLDVHHVKRFESFGYVVGENENYKTANRLSNLVVVCRGCHTHIESLDLDNRNDVLKYTEQEQLLNHSEIKAERKTCETNHD